MSGAAAVPGPVSGSPCVHDVRPCAYPPARSGCSGLAAAGLAGWTGRPPTWPSWPSPHPSGCTLRPVLGTVPPLRVTSRVSASFHLSLLSFPVSVFLPFGFCVPRPQRLCPFLSWLPLHLSSLCTPLAVPRGCRSPCICRPLPPSHNVCLALSSFLISVSLSLPLPPAPLLTYPSGPGPSPPLHPLSLTPGSGRRIRCLEMWRRPFLPCPLSPRGAQLELQSAWPGRGADRVMVKQGLARGVPEVNAVLPREEPLSCRARPLLAAPLTPLRPH